MRLKFGLRLRAISLDCAVDSGVWMERSLWKLRSAVSRCTSAPSAEGCANHRTSAALLNRSRNSQSIPGYELAAILRGSHQLSAKCS